ncbi:hypothetical protein DYB32_002282 [Aphanomyces invadans]|uniref:N-acetyltransferase domain-containing protein n=1 Tax=Aphanomyces invadans TaxID=157072 RepID=A0A418B3T5_9STRA|nr:hypothetical protein DYB32_002282 [Aphanomyces invadans]
MWTSLTGIYLSPTFSPSDAATLGRIVSEVAINQLPQASGPAASIHSFNEGYCKAQSPALTPQWKETLLVYVLKTLKSNPANGSLLQATDADSDLLKAWIVQFCDALHYPVEMAEPFHRRSMERKSLHVWHVDGSIVGFVGYHPPVVHDGETIFRIGPVYVTPQERRKGYASAMTAALSQYLQDGCHIPSRVMLFADAMNPASNKAYQNVGFVQHSEVGVYTFVK